MFYIGIDPGLTGGIVALNKGGGIVELESFDGRNPLEVIKNVLDNTSRHGDIDTIMLEQVSAMPGQGVASMFNFGRSYGAIVGLAYGLGYNLNLVTPQVWQRILADDGSFDGPKDRIRRAIVAEGLEKRVTLKRSMHQGVCDAYFIAKYAWGLRRSEESVLPKPSVTPVAFKKTKRKTAMKI